MTTGVANTALTAAVYYGLLRAHVPAPIAFTVVYASGVAAVAWLSPRLVIGVRSDSRTRRRVLVWYLAVFVVGVCVASAVANVLSHQHLLNAIITVAVTAPLNFFGLRWITLHGTVTGAGGSAEKPVGCTG